MTTRLSDTWWPAPGTRREAARAGGTLNGFEGVEVDEGHPPDERSRQTLLVRCLRPVPDGLDGGALTVRGGVRAGRVPETIKIAWAMSASALATAYRDHPRQPGEDRIAAPAALAAMRDPDRLLVVRTYSGGGFATCRLALTEPHRYGFDPRLAEIAFTFGLDRPEDTDPRPPRTVPAEAVPAPALPPPAHYLSRDYAGLRRLLLDRMSLLLPDWSDRSPADLGVTLAEIFAYLGDQLAYAQDAVATEAYLGTARRRISVRRHARLLDYPMHDGAAARTWLAFEADPDATAPAILPAGTEVRAADVTDARGTVFHTLHPISVVPARNEIEFHTWGEEPALLPAGATGATLAASREELDLKLGDVLILEEVRGADGLPQTADPARRQAVRLDADPVADTDPLTGCPLLRVSWHQQDAPPFPLRLSRNPDPGCPGGPTVVRANVVLAEHGASVGPEPLIPAEAPPRGRYRPRLARTGLAHSVPYDHAHARTAPAADALAAHPATAVPALTELHDGTADWTAVPDLVAADSTARHYTVETDDDGRAFLRFGDGRNGRAPAPGTLFSAVYRVGGGTAGNVGREALTRLSRPLDGIRVRNPLPATGGTDPEPVEQVRQWAPQAFRVPQRAVTDADHAQTATRHPQVQQATAVPLWTGSWTTRSVTVQRRDGLPQDRAFRDRIAHWLDDHRIAGTDIQVATAVHVPLDIVLTVHVAPGHRTCDVRQALADTFTAGPRADGTPGFFHPENLHLGASVHLSRIFAAAMGVHGVLWVDTDDTPPKPNRFRRWGRPPAGELATGRIPMRRQEVARCLSDPGRPEHGRIDFRMEDGR